MGASARVRGLHRRHRGAARDRRCRPSPAKRTRTRRAQLAAAMLRVYDPLSIAALGVAIMTGAFSLTAYKAALRGAFFERLGGPLAWKLFFTFILINLGAYIAFGIGHRIVRAVDAGEPPDAAQLDAFLRRLRTSACWRWCWSRSSSGWRCGTERRTPVAGRAPPPYRRPSTRRRSIMSHFADVTSRRRSLPADKMKKNNLFTTERLFCDVYCFEPGRSRRRTLACAARTRSTTSSKARRASASARRARGRRRDGGARAAERPACGAQSRPGRLNCWSSWPQP